jgi:hypothetical protein
MPSSATLRRRDIFRDRVWDDLQPQPPLTATKQRLCMAGISLEAREIGREGQLDVLLAPVTTATSSPAASTNVAASVAAARLAETWPAPA